MHLAVGIKARSLSAAWLAGWLAGGGHTDPHTHAGRARAHLPIPLDKPRNTLSVHSGCVQALTGGSLVCLNGRADFQR